MAEHDTDKNLGVVEMRYKCLKNDYYHNGSYSITTIRSQDIMLIKKWRNDNMSVLRQNNILTDEDQQNYYNNVILPSISANQPDIILFSYLLNDTCVGYGGLTNIDWTSRRAEISFLLANDRIPLSAYYHKEFSIFLSLMKKVSFEELNLNRLFSETFDIRPVYLKTLEGAGFEFEGRLKQHVSIDGQYVDSIIHGYVKDHYYEASQANMDLFKQRTGWAPEMQLEDTIPELFDFDRKSGSEGPSNAEINILVTSISKKVPLLKSLKTANLKLGNTGKIIGADMDENCIGNYFADIFWEMPELEKIEINDFIGYCRDNKISSVIPTRDGELPFFAKHKELLLENGIRVMISDYDAVQTCLDKLMFFRKADAMGFPVIKTVGNIDELTCEFFVVKERYGAGSDNIGLNLTKEQAVAKAADLEAPIFQPYIYGRELSIDLYVDTSNKTKGAVARNRVLVVNGESQITTTLRNQRLEQLCSDLSEKLNLYGHIVLQAIIDEEENIRIIECNSRFGGASSLSLKVGLDSFYWFLLEASDEDISTYPFIRSINEKKQVRYMEDLII